MSILTKLFQGRVHVRRRWKAENAFTYQDKLNGSVVGMPPGSLELQTIGREKSLMNLTYEYSNLPAQSRGWPVWWEEVNSKSLNHIRSISWNTTVRPKLAEQLPGVELITSSVSADAVFSYLFYLDNVLIMLWWGRREVTFHMASTSPDAFTIAEEKLKTIFPELTLVKDESVRVDFWFMSPNGQGQTATRLLAVPTWKEIEDNYGQAVKNEMERLTGSFRPGHGGQILLWQGPPGTGKTFAIRALMKEWVSWCDSAYVIDPDVFFNNANYMMSVMLESGEEDFLTPTNSDEEENTPTKQPRWTLIVLEDCGEMLAANAKERTGQALSRLLNVADGLIGQGLNVLILITTNEELESLHEAVSRPGRCASKIVFPRLTPEEAAKWREKHDIPPTEEPKGASLAELYGEKEGFAKGPEEARENIGFFTKPKSPAKKRIGFFTSRDEEPIDENHGADLGRLVDEWEG